MLEKSQTVIGVQAEMVQDVLDENSHYGRDLMAVKNLADYAGRWSRLAQSNLQKSVDFCAKTYEIASQAQAEISKLAEERVVKINHDLIDSVASSVQEIPAAEVAVAALKTAADATTNSVIGLSRAIKHAVDEAAIVSTSGVKAARKTEKAARKTEAA